MQVSFSVEKTHLAFFLVGLVVVIGVAYVTAAVPNPGHSWEQIELSAGAWPGLKVEWSEIQGMPAGFADGIDNGTEHISGMFYGLCRYETYTQGCEIFKDAVWPAKEMSGCEVIKCGCESGYTPIPLGSYATSSDYRTGRYFTCYKD